MKRKPATGPFAASAFTATAWSSPEEKAAFANHFVRLVEAGYPEALFTTWFYRRLHHCFGHIAHFDRGGFYAAQLATPPLRLAFLQQALAHPCWGDPAWTYSDVERSLQAWLCGSEHPGRLQREIASDIEAQERALLERLRVRYEGTTPREPVPRFDTRRAGQYVIL